MATIQKILVTGTAGFIGSHVALKLLALGHSVVGVDNINPYYDVSLKLARRERLLGQAGYEDHELDLANHESVLALFAAVQPDAVIHLAAQAGVRYSLAQPRQYTHSNIDGFLSVLEGCRHHRVRHLLYASTSSVYGANTAMPFSEHHVADHPLSLYAASKRANELMAHSYSHLFSIPMTGLRFFTVYGPWGRPDMAPFIFTQSILAGKPIDVFNYGQLERDFTYIDDVADAVVQLLDAVPAPDPEWTPGNPDPGTSGVAPWRVLNIGNAQPVNLISFIAAIETCLGRKAVMNMLPMQPGDVLRTFADTSELARLVGPRKGTTLNDGIRQFIAWYLTFHDNLPFELAPTEPNTNP